MMSIIVTPGLIIIRSIFYFWCFCSVPNWILQRSGSVLCTTSNSRRFSKSLRLVIRLNYSVIIPQDLRADNSCIPSSQTKFGSFNDAVVHFIFLSLINVYSRHFNWMLILFWFAFSVSFLKTSVCCLWICISNDNITDSNVWMHRIYIADFNSVSILTQGQIYRIRIKNQIHFLWLCKTSILNSVLLQ